MKKLPHLNQSEAFSQSPANMVGLVDAFDVPMSEKSIIKICNGNFELGLFTESTFKNCTFESTNFQELKCKKCVFENCSFMNCRLIDNEITEMVFYFFRLW